MYTIEGVYVIYGACNLPMTCLRTWGCDSILKHHFHRLPRLCRDGLRKQSVMRWAGVASESYTERM